MGILSSQFSTGKTMTIDYFRLAAILICVSSVFSTLIVIGSFVHLHNSISSVEQEIVARQTSFKAKSQVIWAELVETGRTLRIPRSAYDSDDKKGVLHQCSQCTRLHCPQGSIGEEGLPGIDGQPGFPGKSGAPGIDGHDIDLEPQQELPCNICPAGPQGPRGAQGERGLTGKQGARGQAGHPGKPGFVGGPGAIGAKGPSGIRGVPGAQGPPGDTVIAGEGIKGPPGLSGPQGPKGPPGTSGRHSNIRGPPGKQGNMGAIGAIGKYGKFGEPGGVGPPGEPGMPSTYCPSDCGVNTILSQLGSTAQRPESINGESGAPAAYPENIDLEAEPEAEAQPAAQKEESAANGATEESFEESSYHNFFFSH